ncbi:MAG TPA: hypothetical protein VHE58_04295 [Burkholderiales bacterium]|nr:hypothetical protein [Burkholderiales bacterium]
MTEAFFSGVCGFTAYLVLTACLLRLLQRKAPALVAITASILVYMVVLLFAILSGRVVMFWYLSATYWFLVLCFLVMFGAVYKSISLRILFDLLNQPTRSELYARILERYIQQESYMSRLQVMMSDGLAVQLPTGFQLTEKGHRIAATIHAVQQAFNIQRSG